MLASGGVSLFLAGVERTVESSPLLGVHAWQHCSQSGDQPEACRDATDYSRDDSEHRLHLDYVSEMLGDDAFYWHSIAAAPSSSTHWPADSEIDSFDLYRVSAESVALPHGLRAAFLEERVAVCGQCRQEKGSGLVHQVPGG